MTVRTTSKSSLRAETKTAGMEYSLPNYMNFEEDKTYGSHKED